MRKSIFAVTCMLLLVACVGLAQAAPYTYTMGGGSWIDTSGTPTDYSLEMQGSIVPGVSGLTFALDVNDSKTFLFASIGTNEVWINEDDLIPGTITAYLDFATPGMVQGVNGTSVGFTEDWLILPDYRQGWTLSWADPVIVNFGNGGQFRIELTNASHSNEGWTGPTGFEDVYATVTHLASPVSVAIPEPATLLLIALGLSGLAVIRRKD